jgi:hypothetical protein
MTNGLQPATPNSGTITLHGNVSPNDPAAVLDGEPLRRVTALHQRALDLHSTVPMWEDVQEVRTEKVQHENRIVELLRPRSEGGFGESEAAGVVIHERAKLKRASDELHRLQTLKESRTARWNACARLDGAVRDWLFAGGIPGGCKVEPIADAQISELLIKADNGRIDAAVERYRSRLRELAADLHKVRSAPWPSLLAKQKAKAQIDALAEAAAPDIDRCIEHGLPILFATTMQTAMVRGMETPAAAFSETTDTFGLLCWLFKDQMLAKINAALDEAADDKAALSREQREEMEARISGDMLAVERSECALIWAAESDGEVFDFRADTSPLAVLGLTLVTAPRVAASGSSWQHALDIVGAGR